MKKLLPYLLGVAALGMLLIIIMASKGGSVRRMDERITLRKRDKIAYGTAAAYRLLPSLFPRATITADNGYPGTWQGIDPDEANQAVILVADFFNGEEDELDFLGRFVERGNTVFLMARSFSDDASAFFKTSFNSYYDFASGSQPDSLAVRLEKPVFSVDSIYTYPGRKYEGRLLLFDTATTAILGHSQSGTINFVQFKKGRGKFFVHTSPLAFSNYFVLHKGNNAYFRQAFSVIPASVTAIVWNEYYLEKKEGPPGKDEKNWLATLFQYPAFKWGFLTALCTLLLYVLLNMRRRQRMIPPYEKPKNDSLDFVKTLGRLYFDRGDHKNLAEKMGAYFLQHVRSTYKIPTHTLDKDFVQTLHAKSGYPQPEIETIINTIVQLPLWPVFGEDELALFHHQLDQYYHYA